MRADRESGEAVPRIVDVGRWLCLACAALGAFGLIGWSFGLPAFTTADPRTPMMPNTALGLLCIGIAGALRSRYDPGRIAKAASLALAAIATAIGVATLAEYALGVDLGIDRALLPLSGGAPPGRPAPATALALALLGTAIGLFDRRFAAHLRPAEWLVLSAAVTAFMSLLGHVFGAPRFDRLPMAPLVAVAVLLGSVGLLLERPSVGVMRVITSRGPGGTVVRRLSWPAIAAALLLGVFASRVADELGVRGDASLLIAVLCSATTVVGLLLLAATAVPLDRAHHELESSRARLRELLDQAPDGVFVADLEGRYTEVNDAGCRMLGYAREEIVGNTIANLIPPGDVARLWQAREQQLGGAVHVSEWRLRRKDGRYLPVEVSARILPDGRWQGIVRDIGRRKRIEAEAAAARERLRRSEREQRLLAEFSAALGASLDVTETLENVARLAIRDFTDCCIVELLAEGGGSRMLVAHCDPEKADVCRAMQRAPEERPSFVEQVMAERRAQFVPEVTDEFLRSVASTPRRLSVLRALGPTSSMTVPMVARGRLLGALAFVTTRPSRRHDRDDLRVAEELAARAALALENALLYQAAQRAIRARDDVLGVVVHDLRNPLTSILMQSELLHRPTAEPERSIHAAEAIHRAAMRMNRLIQDLLDVTRIETGPLPLACAPLAPGDVVAEAIDAQRSIAEAASLVLRAELESDLPEVWGDHDRLLQAFENLIGNAAKFTPPGGRITVGAARVRGEVQFWVADTGAGIPEADQPHVFDRFYQAREPGRRGAGLGLAIVKGIVEAHGGRLWLESAVGRGSTFHFTVPAAAAAERGRPGPPPHPT